MRIVPLGGLGQIGRNMNVLASLKKSSWASWLQALALTATGGEGASRFIQHMDEVVHLSKMRT